MSDAHLLGILIGPGDRCAKKNAVDLSQDLLSVFGTLENLDQAGDPTPSQKDFKITHRLNQTGKIIGIHMVDHIIIGGNGFFSFSDEGLL